MTGWKLMSVKCLLKTRPTAVRISSRAIVSAPLSSPSYSSSILPVMAGIAAYSGFLCGDGHLFLDGCGVVRANFGANAVFERGDNFPTRGVILGIGGEDDEHVEWQPQRIALNLNVAFLHDVEEADLNFSGQVGKFVNC